MSRLFLSLVLVLLAVQTALAAGPELVLTQETGPGNPRNSEGAFVTLKDGRILYVYTRFLGTHSGDDAQGYLASCFSDDGGRTWQESDKPLFPKEGKENDMSVSMLRLVDGRIALFYLVKNSIMDCKVRMRISEDEAKTWSDSIDCMPGEENYFVVNNDRVIQTPSGRLIMPAAAHVRDGKWHGAADIVCFLSDDAGKTWRRAKQTLEGRRENGTRYITQEPGVVQLKDGRVMLWVRTDLGVQSVCYSEDEAETFTPLAPWNLRSPVSPASIKRIPSTGDLLVIWNDSGTRQRSPLSSAISKDDGKTWEHQNTLEADPKGWYCYTAIHFTKEHALLSYWDMADKQIETKVVRVPIDWLYRTSN
ncbi:sialidase family protein [Bremerella sp. JC770]|uniref:sialidase family protein n=1 Tax=Bremerella sp. JC770 TaxID=3232137 RepID=UPI00345B1F94